MTDMSMLLQVALFCLLGIAAFTDIQTRKIPNLIPVLVLVLFVIGAMLVPDIRAGIGYRLLGFLVTIGIGFALFATGEMGGGDIKLMAALSLWHPLTALPNWIFLIAVSGGILAIFYIAQAKFVRGSAMAGMKTSVPYAVAILMGEALLFMNLKILPFGPF